MAYFIDTARGCEVYDERHPECPFLVLPERPVGRYVGVEEPTPGGLLVRIFDLDALACVAWGVVDG